MPVATDVDKREVSEDEKTSRVETLVEYANSGGLSPQVDADAGVITGVKILGLESRNGRVYQPQGVAEAAALYEGVKVNVDHPKRHAAASRDYRDRLGCIRNVRAAEQGLFADLHFNPRHSIAAQLAWDAQWAPENVGLSHNVQARTSRRGGQTIVEEILKVNSVDLVADPATTTGLFESNDEAASHDLLQEAKQEVLRQRRQVEAWIREARLPAEAVTPEFFEPLLELEEPTARGLIRERAEFIRVMQRTHHRPKSKGPMPDAIGVGVDLRQWARAIT